MSVTIERCSNEGITCEYFQTWNFSRICSIAFMKGQIWSPVVQTTVPKFSCPHVKKVRTIQLLLYSLVVPEPGNMNHFGRINVALFSMIIASLFFKIVTL